jgi:hypothetical protein
VGQAVMMHPEPVISHEAPVPPRALLQAQPASLQRQLQLHLGAGTTCWNPCCPSAFAGMKMTAAPTTAAKVSIPRMPSSFFSVQFVLDR